MKKYLLLSLFVIFTFYFSFAQRPFITTWKTDNPGVSGDNQITIPTFPGETYNYTVDWGDGTLDTNVTGDITHTYATLGTYTVSISGDFPRIHFLIATDEEKIIAVNQWGDIEWRSMEEAFFGCRNMNVSATDVPDLSNVTSTAGMFTFCLSLIGNATFNNWDVSTIINMEAMFNAAINFDQPIGQWNVSSVINMARTFSGATNFNQDIGNWDVSNVTSMERLFEETFLFNQDIGNWDVSKVTDMKFMFESNPNFNQDIGGWNVSQVQDMGRMFEGTSFDHDIGNWDVGNVRSMGGMFFGARSFNQDIGDWNVSNVNDMVSMFLVSETFNQDISNWDVSNVTDMGNMFGGALNFDQNLGTWDISKVKARPELGEFLGSGMGGMFANSGLSNENYDKTLIGWSQLPSLQNGVQLDASQNQYCLSETARQNIIDTYGWTINDGGKAEDCQRPFITTWKTDNPGVSEDNQITIPTFSGETYDYVVNWGDGTSDTNVTGDITHTYEAPGTYTVSISGIFPRIYFNEVDFSPPITSDAHKLLSVQDWGSMKWNSMKAAFAGCLNLDVVAPNVPDLSNVTSTAHMFQNCNSLVGTPIFNSWDTSTVTDMSEMFSGARNYNQDIGSWNTSLVTDMSAMFALAVTFNQNIGLWDVSNVEDMTRMFKVSNFNGDVSNWDVGNVQNMEELFSETKFNQDISNWNVSNVTSMIEMFQHSEDFNQDLSNWDIGNLQQANSMFDFSGLSDENYNAILIGWSQQSLQQNVIFGAGQNQYCQAEDERQSIMDTYGWTINDGGKATDCQPSNLDSDSDGILDQFDQCPNTPLGEDVDEKGCEYTNVLYEHTVENASKWFGGDDRPEFDPRNVGTGQSVFVETDIILESFSAKFTSEFDFRGMPDNSGHEVELVLQLRDSEGAILSTVNKTLSANFDGGWVRFVFSEPMALEGNSTYTFTWYLKDGLTNFYTTGSSGDVTSSYQFGDGFSSTIEENGSDSDFNDFSSWFVHPWDFLFKMTGERIIEEFSVKSFTLIDADNNTDLFFITDGQQLNINGLPTLNLDIRANVTEDTESVEFQLSGVKNAVRTENVEPYALFGDVDGNYNGMQLVPGEYILSASAYGQNGLQGNSGDSLTINFSVVDIANDFEVSLSRFTDPSTCGGDDGTMNLRIEGDSSELFDITLEGPVFKSIPGLSPLGVLGVGGLPAGDYLWTVEQRSTGGKETIEVRLSDPDPPVVTLAAFANVQESDPTFTLTGGSPAGGDYSGPGVSGGMFDPGTVGPGTYPITYTYTDPTTLCEGSDTKNITVQGDTPSTLAVTSFNLIDADNDVVIQVLMDGDVIDLNTLTTDNLSIQALATNDVESVFMELSGDKTSNMTENVAPYALFGNVGSDYNGMVFGVGSYTVKAIPYSGNGLTGTMGTDRMASFTIVNDPGPDTTPPVITLLGSDPQNITIGDAYVEQGATAFDNIDGNISGQIVIDASQVDVNTLGTYEVTYNVTDAAGNPATEVIRTVIVMEAVEETSLSVLDSSDDSFLFFLSDGQMIPQSQVEGLLLGIVYESTNGASFVSFNLTGPINQSRNEGLAPFSLFGDIGVDIQGTSFPVGNYTLVANPNVGPTVTVQFSIFNDLPPAIPPPNRLSIWPNPSNIMAHASFEQPIEIQKIMVFDMKGRLVRTYAVESIGRTTDFELNVQDLPAGTYFVRTQDENGFHFQKQMIIRR